MEQLSKLKLVMRAALVDTLNREAATVATAYAAYVNAIADYNAALAEVREWRDVIVAIMKRSEAWRQSDTYSDYRQWAAEYKDTDLFDLDQPPAPDLEHADQIENLPVAPSATSLAA